MLAYSILNAVHLLPMKKLLLLLYYLFLQRIPMHPIPGWKIGYALRAWVAKRVFLHCGKNVIIKDRCYFGDGHRMSLGDRSQLGQNSRMQGTITIGDDCVMGPDVVMMATSHEFKDIDTPINRQGPRPEEPIVIGNDCWIGTRVVILPGVRLGNQCIVAAGAVVTHSFPDGCIIGGVPAKLIRNRLG